MKKQSENHIALFIKLLFISVSLLLLSIIFILFYAGYEKVANFILDVYQVSDKSARFKAKYFTPLTFKFIQFFLIFFGGIFLSLSFILKNKIELFFIQILNVVGEFKGVLISILNEVANLRSSYKILFLFLMFVILVTRLYFLFIFPLTNDEVFSYLYFVNKGFLVTISYYPGPNNHVFYSLLCVFTDIFLDDPVLVMRIPILIIGLLVSFLMFVLINKKIGFFASFFSTIIFSFAWDSFYYSLHGRGYMLISFFVLVLFFSFFKIIETNFSKKIYSVLFAIASIFGFYTIPTFLYPFLCIFLFGGAYWILKQELQGLKNFFLLNTFIGVSTLILYSPIILFSGMSALTSNKWVSALPGGSYPELFQIYPDNLFNYLLNIEARGLVIIFILVALVSFISFIRKKYVFSILTLIFFLLPFVIMFIQKVLPPFRTLDYLLLFISILFGIALQAFVEFIKIKIFRNFVFFSLCLGIFLIDMKYLQHEKNGGFSFYTRLNTFVEQAFSGRIDKIFVNEDTYQLFFKLKIQQTQCKTQVFTEPGNIKKFDLVVIPHGTKFPVELNKSDYEYYICNKDIDSFKNKLLK